MSVGTSLFDSPLNIEQAWRSAASLLVNSESARLDSQLLLLHALEKTERSYLLTWPERELSQTQIDQFSALIKQRITGVPVAHLIGNREFWGLALAVNASTLIPRPDTEVIIETVLDLYQHQLNDTLKALDLGTGTGAIALALKSECPNWQIDAVEYSKQAAELAQQNSTALNLAINIYQGSWFEPLNLNPQQYQLIVSNPPYIEENDPHLAQGDVRFEPESALVAANNGMADIEHIIETAQHFLADQAWLILEHGYQQAGAVQAVFNQYASYQLVQTISDLSGQPRITLAQFKK
ncbi:peptide chain release factor N(5)-glutamine methyltransferase [Catenovulum sp. 2E275]|uniref:peptide chain release factor N(5)-glutamine methyltransferase n=1 Tax=Catenovulum sp. 2E275 TaxID=2980497 RepID=UPI0021CF10C8|nr:peptide chain release factor N(5)-glutamine methyltransferase [Catenovulum sp. 2E275]MCU4675353.1 peptide chain release factor N(5)-glutamine methyltransferase [Catenovulum sp. 2E275]